MFKIIPIFIISISLSISLITSSINVFQNFGASLVFPLDVFAQGLVRCTNGELVDSPGRCPSTDLCPSPSGTDSVVNCSHREDSKPQSSEKKKGENEKEFAISTDEDNYKKGENVEIIVKNRGSEPIVFPKSNTHLKVKDLKEDETIPLSIDKKFVLDSGGSKTFTWDQRDPNGDQVGTGKYRASISSGSHDDKSNFRIST
jgi:hypothetical protein